MAETEKMCRDIAYKSLLSRVGLYIGFFLKVSNRSVCSLVVLALELH